MNHHSSDEHSIKGILRDLNTQLVDLLNTRYQMFKTEIKEKLELSKTIGPLLVVVLALFSGAFAALTFALIALVRSAFADSIFGWAIGAAIIGFAYLLLGGIGIVMLRQTIRKATLVPERTLKVLKQDQRWLEKEVA